MKWRVICEVGLAGAFGDNGTDISIVFTTIHESISTLYSSCKQHGKYYSRNVRWTGYSTSTSSVKLSSSFLFVPLLCWVDVRRYIRLRVARSDTPSPTVPAFSFVSSFTLDSQPSSPMHSSLPPPLYLHFHCPTSCKVLFPSHHVPVLTRYASSLEHLCDFSHFQWLAYSFFPYHIVLVTGLITVLHSFPYRIFTFISSHPTLHTFSSSSFNRSGTSSSSVKNIFLLPLHLRGILCPVIHPAPT